MQLTLPISAKIKFYIALVDKKLQCAHKFALSCAQEKMFETLPEYPAVTVCPQSKDFGLKKSKKKGKFRDFSTV